MHRSDVSAQVALLRETLAASFTGIVLDSGVNLDMSIDVAFLGETFATNLIREGSKHCLSKQ